MIVIDLIDLISSLETQKWELSYKTMTPQNQTQMEKVERKLKRLYEWFGTAKQNGMVDRYPSTPFGPGLPESKTRKRRSLR